jgi:glycosyltransferase involved in cell wall biosynthesis
MSPGKRLRLGVDFHEWDGIFQGSRSHVLNIYKEAIKAFPEVDFLFFLGDTQSLAAQHSEFRSANVKLVHMAPSHGLVRLGLRLPYLCWRHRLDVLHTQYRVPFIRPSAVACTIHDVLFETHPQFFTSGFVREARFTFRMAVKRAALLFSVSQYSKNELCRLYGADPDKVRVTYNGVDRRRFYPGPDGAQQVADLGLVPGHYILVVGRLEPRKNHLALIEAWSRLGSDAPPLVIVGQEDPGFPDVKQAIERAAQANKVMLFSQLGDDVLPAVIRHAELFVYPAFAEGFGMPVAEAMASGVPVMTSNTTSLPEVAGDGALLFNPASPDELFETMKRALAMTPEARARLVQQALLRVEQFAWQRSADILMRGILSLRVQ